MWWLFLRSAIPIFFISIYFLIANSPWLQTSVTVNNYIQLVQLKLKVKESVNHSVTSDSLRPQGLYGACQDPVSMRFSSKNTAVGCHALLQGTLPTQGSNPGLLCFSQILYHLNYPGSPCSNYHIVSDSWLDIHGSSDIFQRKCSSHSLIYLRIKPIFR